MKVISALWIPNKTGSIDSTLPDNGHQLRFVWSFDPLSISKRSRRFGFCSLDSCSMPHLIEKRRLAIPSFGFVAPVHEKSAARGARPDQSGEPAPPAVSCTSQCPKHPLRWAIPLSAQQCPTRHATCESAIHRPTANCADWLDRVEKGHSPDTEPSDRVHKKKRGSPLIQGFPDMKKGDRENLSPAYGGGA